MLIKIVNPIEQITNIGETENLWMLCKKCQKPQGDPPAFEKIGKNKGGDNWRIYSENIASFLRNHNECPTSEIVITGDYEDL